MTSELRQVRNDRHTQYICAKITGKTLATIRKCTVSGVVWQLGRRESDPGAKIRGRSSGSARLVVMAILVALRTGVN